MLEVTEGVLADDENDDRVCKGDSTALPGQAWRWFRNFAKNKQTSDGGRGRGWSWEMAIKANVCRNVHLYTINLDKNKY